MCAFGFLHYKVSYSCHLPSEEGKQTNRSQQQQHKHVTWQTMEIQIQRDTTGKCHISQDFVHIVHMMCKQLVADVVKFPRSSDPSWID
jgi:hypothetical protein